MQFKLLLALLALFAIVAFAEDAAVPAVSELALVEDDDDGAMALVEDDDGADMDEEEDLVESLPVLRGRCANARSTCLKAASTKGNACRSAANTKRAAAYSACSKNYGTCLTTCKNDNAVCLKRAVTAADKSYCATLLSSCNNACAREKKECDAAAAAAYKTSTDRCNADQKAEEKACADAYTRCATDARLRNGRMHQQELALCRREHTSAHNRCKGDYFYCMAKAFDSAAQNACVKTEAACFAKANAARDKCIAAANKWLSDHNGNLVAVEEDEE